MKFLKHISEHNFMFVMFVGVQTKRTWNVFACIRLGKDADDLFMVHSLNTPCWEHEHIQLVFKFGLPMIVLYVLGIPLLNIAVLHHNAEFVDNDLQQKYPVDVEKHRKQMRFVKTYAFLYRGYRHEVCHIS